MPNFKVTRKFTFDSAHALSKGYEGKCKNIHGHTWTVELTIVVDSYRGLNEFDMVIDFSELKEVCNKVKERFDHKLILGCDDPNVVHMENIVILDKNPTVEVLCMEISNMAYALIDFKRYDNIEVTIWETPDSKCFYG